MIDSPLVLRQHEIYTLNRTHAHSRLLHFRGPRESAGFRVSRGPSSFYVAYLDEFGHVGPFISRAHEMYNASPVFGLGGFVLPVERVRPFASWFYRLKCNLLAFEIERAGVPPYRWEKKGASLYTTQNILRYSELRHATTRLSIKRLDTFCRHRQSLFTIIIDEQKGRAFREEIVEEASREMFGDANRLQMIEPPIQAQSHLFQTLQCADWICGLVGRAGCYLVSPVEYEDFIWVPKYFSEQLARIAPLSSIRRRGMPEPMVEEPSAPH